jgi:pyruvate,orthophosphate dikinase
MTFLQFTDQSDRDSDEAMARAYFGGKGLNLRIMARKLDLPVPPGFTIPTTFTGKDFDDYAIGTRNEIFNTVALLGDQVGKVFGLPSNPLLLSVRSGAPVSMPGMMDTILNVGLNDQTVVGLAKQTSEDFAYDCYRRFIQMYSETVLQQEGLLDLACKSAQAFCGDGLMPAPVSKLLIRKFKKLVNFPQDVNTQLLESVKAVFASWDGERAREYRTIENIPYHIGTACTVQVMVFGNLNSNSGTGVVFTRNPANGTNERYGDFLVCAQGEDVVAGTHATLSFTEMERLFPEQYKQLSDHMDTLEEHFQDMCDIEFTIEDGKLYVLQTRTGKRSTQAAVRIAVDMVREFLISPDEATSRIMKSMENLSTESGVRSKLVVPFASGMPANGGYVEGVAAFSRKTAIALAEEGENVILIRPETQPKDVAAISKSVGLVTLSGGLVSHAAVVARAWNKPCVVSAKMRWDEFTFGTVVVWNDQGDKIQERDMVALNAVTGEIMRVSS